MLRKGSHVEARRRPIRDLDAVAEDRRSRSQMAKTSGSLWLMKITATPSALRRRTISNNNDLTSRSVSAVVGSSMAINRAPWTSARAIATTCLSATFNSSTSTFTGTATPTLPPCSAIRLTARQETMRPPSDSWSLKAMFSATVRLGNKEDPDRSPRSRRARRRSAADRPRPPVHLDGSGVRRHHAGEDLPRLAATQFSPARTTISPASMARLTSCSA